MVLLSGTRSHDLSPRNRLKAETIVNLKFHGIIREAVQALENKNLKHYDPIERWSSGIAMVLWFVENDIENRSKYFPVDVLLQYHQRIFELGETF